MRRLLVLFCLTLAGCGADSEPRPLRIAVAANFAPTLDQLLKANGTMARIDTMQGSTGLLTAQIEAGANYDLFFAADSQRPQYLVNKGLTHGPAYDYALGRLALWAAAGNTPPRQRLTQGSTERLVIANPALAPYGRAAQEVLKAEGLWSSMQPRLVRAENVAAAWQYLVSGTVPLGFVALSQLRALSVDEQRAWLPPPASYRPIRQQAVILRGEYQVQARALLDWCLSEAGREQIAAAGYALP